MKEVQLTIRVSDKKYNQLIEFLTQNFGDAAVNTREDFYIPEEHKEMVQKRIENAEDKDFISLEELDKKN